MDGYKKADSRLRCCATCRHSHKRVLSGRLECTISLPYYLSHNYAVGRKMVCNLWEAKTEKQLMHEARERKGKF